MQGVDLKKMKTLWILICIAQGLAQGE